MPDRCEVCGHGKWIRHGEAAPACHTAGCPGNPETDSKEDPCLLVAIRDAIVAEACRYRGIDKPTTNGEYTRIEDIFRYAQVALKVIRKFDKDEADRG